MPTPGERDTGQAARRRLFLSWTACMWLAWLLSGEMAKVAGTPAALAALVLPPWPHAAGAILSALRAVFGAALALAATAGCGKAVLRLASVDPPVPDGAGVPFSRILPPRRLFALAAGIPAAALLLQGLGLVGLFRTPVLVAAAGAAAVAVALLPGSRPVPAPSPGGSGPLGVLCLIAVAVVAVASLAPEVAWDAMVYHLRAPALWLLAGRVHPVPEIFPSFFPFSGEMLMGLALAPGGDGGARLLHAGFWLATGLATGYLAHSLWGAVAAPWGAAFMLTLPLAMVIGSRGYVEFFAVLPLLCAVLLLRRGTGRRTFALAGWLAGAAAGTKYQAGMAAAIVLGWFVITLRPSFGSILAAMAAGTAACGAWFVRNLVWTGNPFYPLLFGGPRWTAWDMAGWRADASAFTFDPFVLLASPWRLLNRPLDDGGISPLILTAAAAPVLWGSARNAVWALAGLFLLAWWATAPLTRYLSGALALACAAAAGTYAGRGMGAAAERWLGRLALAGAALSLACGFMSIQFGTEPLGAAIGKWSPDEYRNRRLAPDGFTGVLAGLERLVPRNGRACIMGHPFAYGLPRRAWSDFFYVHPPLYWWTLGARSGEEIAKRARQAGLTHIAWHPAGGRAFYGRNPGMLAWDERTLSAWVEFWRMHVRQADRIAQWRIFAVSRRALPPAPLPAPGVPGAEALTEPADRALERREFNAAERLAAGALALHPSIAPYLRDRIARARRGAGPPVDYGLE